MTSALQNAVVNIRTAWRQPESILEFDLCRLFRDPTDNWAQELLSPPVEPSDPYPNGTANRALLMSLEKNSKILQAMRELGTERCLPIAFSEIYELTLTNKGFQTSLREEIYEQFAKAERDLEQRQSRLPPFLRTDDERRSLHGGLALLEEIYRERLEPHSLDGMLLLGETHVLSIVDRFLRQSSEQ